MVKEMVRSICQISDESVKEIESILEYEEYDKNEVFIEKDRKNNREYFLVEGVCKSYLINPDGDEITISFFSGRAVLSPFTTRNNKGTSNINFKALTTIKLASLDAGAFESLMVDNLEIRHFGNEVLRNELMRKIDKEIGFASFTAKERLIQFRQHYPMLENIVPHTDIATYLGITNISLSRLRKSILKIR